MAVAIAQNPIWQHFFKLMIRLLVGENKQRLYHTIDWQQESDRFRQVDLVYPDYYSSQNFHGIEGGYLDPVAAVTIVAK